MQCFCICDILWLLMGSYAGNCKIFLRCRLWNLKNSSNHYRISNCCSRNVMNIEDCSHGSLVQTLLLLYKHLREFSVINTLDSIAKLRKCIKLASTNNFNLIFFIIYMLNNYNFFSIYRLIMIFNKKITTKS